MSGLKQRPDSGRENSISSGQIVRLWFFFFYHLPLWKQAWFVSGVYRTLPFHPVSVWERWGAWGGGDPESPLIFHITVTGFSFLEVVCCKVLKVFCDLGCLGMNGIGLLGSLSHTLTEMCGWVFCRTYPMTQVFPNLCSGIPKIRWIVHVCLKISLFWSY